jgi:hypothetical protein
MYNNFSSRLRESVRAIRVAWDGDPSSHESPPTPELAFLLDLLRCAYAENSSAGIVIPNQINWSAFVDLIIYHKLIPHTYKLLTPIKDRVPPKITQIIQQHRQMIIRQNKMLAVEMFRVLHELQRANIAAMVLKGIPLSLQLYGSLEHRQISDIDLLCCPDQRSAAIDVLYGLGYRGEAPGVTDQTLKFGYHFPMQNDQHHTSVELHWKVFPSYLDVFLEGDSLWRHSTTVPLYNKQVPTLALEKTFWMLCIHGTKHQWEKLGWIADIMQFMSMYPSLNYEQVLQTARDYSSKQMVLLAVKLAHEISATTPLSGFEKELTANSSLTSLVHQVKLIWNQPYDIYFRKHVFQIKVRRRLREQYRYIRIKQPYLDESITLSDLARPSEYQSYYYLLLLNRVVRKYLIRPILDIVRKPR